MNIVIHDPGVARATRLDLWSEHLQLPAVDLDRDTAEVIDQLWQPLADEQFQRRRRGEPLTHKLLALPHVSRRANALRGPINSLFVDG